MHCSKCGCSNDELSRFCQDCGFRLGSSPHPGSGQGGRVSKGFFIVSIASGLGISLLLGAVANVLSYRSPEQAVYYHIPAYILMLFAYIVFLVLIFRMWEAIQDGSARTTPGKAVGYLFIPIYGLFWIFVAVWGFAVDYNKYLSRYSLAHDRLPQGLFLAYPILLLGANFAQLLDILEHVDINAILSLAGLIVLLVTVSRICDAVNSLPVTDAPDVRPAAAAN